LPTVYELQTIMLPELPCHPSPFIDPIFGPTAADFYWSSTSSAELPGSAWIVFFDGSNVNAGYDGKSDYRPVRAAHGGL